MMSWPRSRARRCCRGVGGVVALGKCTVSAIAGAAGNGITSRKARSLITVMTLTIDQLAAKQ
jgi:hypothetical protein